MKVKELINILNGMPQDSTVVIADTDTNWHLEIEYVSGPDAKDDTVTISGSYENVRRGLK